MLNDILLQISSDQVSPLSLHLRNVVSIEGNSPALNNFFVLSECFLSMAMNSSQKKQCVLQLYSLLPSDRKDRLKLSLVSLVCTDDEDFLKGFLKSCLQFLCARTQGKS